MAMITIYPWLPCTFPSDFEHFNPYSCTTGGQFFTFLPYLAICDLLLTYFID
ncbi:hypothetical protein BDW67DRAFT_59 [Aspergillus spinulosporus]